MVKHRGIAPQISISVSSHGWGKIGNLYEWHIGIRFT